MTDGIQLACDEQGRNPDRLQDVDSVFFGRGPHMLQRRLDSMPRRRGGNAHDDVHVGSGRPRLREAWIAARRASIPAPVDGCVAKRIVQLGQRVTADAPLMSIVPLRQMWVEAKFKEVQRSGSGSPSS